MPLTPQLDLKLICSFGTSLGVGKQRLPTLATFAMLWGSAAGHGTNPLAREGAGGKDFADQLIDGG